MLQLRVLCLFTLYLNAAYSLKCHAEDGIMDADLKRVARACMHRMNERNYKNNNGGAGSGVSDNGSNGQSYRQSYGERNQNADEHYRPNSNNKNRNYDYDYNDEQRHWNDPHEDLLLERNRQRMQHFGPRSTAAGHGNGGNGGGGSNGSGRSSSSGNNGNHQRNGMSTTSSSSSLSPRNGQNRANNDTHDENTCITLCFFQEMNMLNSEDYPDRQKMNYMLTKDLRDNELRNFYMDTLQQCFRYLENQRRRDRCQYSRELIKCMSEYAKANCDDWEQYESLIFN